MSPSQAPSASSWLSLPFELKSQILQHTVSLALQSALSANGIEKRELIAHNILALIEFAPELHHELAKCISAHRATAYTRMTQGTQAGPWEGWREWLAGGPLLVKMGREERSDAIRVWYAERGRWGRRVDVCERVIRELRWMEREREN